MTQVTDGVQFENRVLDALNQLDYRVMTNPPSSGGGWKDRISSWLREPSKWPGGPDMVVKDGENVVLVEVKAYPILLGPVIQAGHYANYYKAPILICVPDEAFSQIPESVREWAEDNKIAISPIAEVVDRVRVLMEDGNVKRRTT